MNAESAAQTNAPLKILLLGSTGSIGTSTLACIRRNPDRFSISGLGAFARTSILTPQIDEFSPRWCAVAHVAAAQGLRSSHHLHNCTLVEGPDACRQLAETAEYDMLVNALVGAAGFTSTVAALTRGKLVALANKESLVIGGELINTLLHTHGGKLLPVDSEHSAIAQCLRGEDLNRVEGITLTASGGPFRTIPLSDFARLTPTQALAHPTWTMGKKITLDSATLVNKGFELIEAHHLFGTPWEQLHAVIHPQSIIHSLVEFIDGAVMAQLGIPDMELPIQYALTQGERLILNQQRLNLAKLGQLSFFAPEPERYPCLAECIRAGRQGGLAPVILNAANEVAVDLFLKEKIGFCDIARLLGEALDSITAGCADSVEAILAKDSETRQVLYERYTDPSQI